MGVRKLRNSWWIDFQFNSRRYRKRSPENSRAGALAYETLLRGRLARGEPLDGTTEDIAPTFEQFAWQWFDDYVVPNNKYSEQRQKRIVLRSSLIPFFGKLRLTEITTRHIDQYKVKALESGLARKSVNNYLTILRRCVYMAFEWLDLPGRPPTVMWLKCLPTTADYLSPDECSLLLAHASGTTYEMILTALRTGMRQGELKALQWSSIDWQNRSIAVQHSRCDYSSQLTSPKSNRIRYIPMDVDVYEMLYARKANTGYVFVTERGEPFDRKLLRRHLSRVCDLSGLRKVGWHALRHTFASHLVMRGVPMTAVQMLLGHSSITTTMRYAHLAPSTLRSAIDLLNPRTALDAGSCQPAVNAWVENQRQELLHQTHLQNSEELQAKRAA